MTLTGTNENFRHRLAELLCSMGPREGDDPYLAIATPARPRDESPTPAAAPPVAVRPTSGAFLPLAPACWEQSGLGPSEIEALVVKYLLNCGAAPGRQIAEQVRLPFNIVERVLRGLKDNLLVVYKSSTSLADYVYELTEPGFERARRYSQRCTYFGAAPVSLAAYVASVEAQSIASQRPRLVDLRRALADLVLSDELIGQIGQAVNSGLGLFLYGAPGNGKTSIAERIVRAFGETVWIPRAVSVFGEIIRLYDPSGHEAVAEPESPEIEQIVDKRWVRIRRPTIVVGGELSLESLEVRSSTATGISEAPLQWKANCGTLVIDDFGRQRCSAAELLNRWIVPLEKRYDYLTLHNGRKIQVPFDELIIFSTNLEPQHLVDEAFLRRIPYKIDVPDPTEEQFRRLIAELAAQRGIAVPSGAVDDLIERHYRQANRKMRFCHPRDLLRQVGIYCNFHDRPAALSPEAVDAAVKNYFAILSCD